MVMVSIAAIVRAQPTGLWIGHIGILRKQQNPEELVMPRRHIAYLILRYQISSGFNQIRCAGHRADKVTELRCCFLRLYNSTYRASRTFQRNRRIAAIGDNADIG